MTEQAEYRPTRPDSAPITRIVGKIRRHAAEPTPAIRRFRFCGGKRKTLGL